jgi:predicted ArsR family transcriptional regulator
MKLAGDSTKSRVLYVLRGSGGGTAANVAQTLEISIPAARRHLMDLEADGWLESKVYRQTSRGRPQHVFRVSQAGEAHFPTRYAQLCSDILLHIERLYGSGAVLSVLDSRNQALLTQWQPRVQGSLETRVIALAEILSELGYQTSLEVHPQGWVLVQNNCPNLNVARDFEALCNSETSLYQQLLNTPVKRETRVLDGSGACRYLIER